MVKRKKIIHISINLGIGGVERFIVDLANQFTQDHDVILYLTEKPNEFNRYYFDSLNPSVQVNTFRFPNSLFLRYFYEIFKILANEKPDVVHIHTPSLILPLIPAIILKGRSVAFVQTIHGKTETIHHQRYWMLKQLLKLIYKSGLVKTVAVSYSTADQFKDYFDVACSKVIYNSRFNLSYIAPFDNVSLELGKNKLNNNIVLIHIGRYDIVKNQLMLVKAIQRVNSMGHSLKLFVIGNNFEGTDVERMADDSIVFLGPKENPIDYLRQADGMCMSSISEAMPLVLIEALYAGCIPISTNVGGIGEIIIDGENGFLSDQIDLNSYCDTLLRFIRDRHKIHIARLKLDFTSNFDASVCSESYRLIYFR